MEILGTIKAKTVLDKMKQAKKIKFKATAVGKEGHN